MGDPDVRILGTTGAPFAFLASRSIGSNSPLPPSGARTRRPLGACFRSQERQRLFPARRRADFGRAPRLVYESFMTKRKKRRGGKKSLAFADDSLK
jgi:hypothetical protein